jgi:TolA-binding protein
VLAVLGCAGGNAQLRAELDALRAEVGALRHENDGLSRRVETLQGRVDVVSTRLARTADPVPAAAPDAAAPEPLVPRTLAVVRVAPRESAPAPIRFSTPPAARTNTPPPIPTNIPITEPDPAQLDRLALRTGRELSAEATRELRAARGRAGLDRAHALEDFAARYPRHPEADNALVDAAASYVDAGRDDAACALAARVSQDYPAGDAMSDSLERLAWCESRHGLTDAERRILARLVQEHPGTPAAHRAEERLAQITGPTGSATADGAPSK